MQTTYTPEPGDTMDDMMGAAADIINRLIAENEALKVEQGRMLDLLTDMEVDLEDIEAENSMLHARCAVYKDENTSIQSELDDYKALYMEVYAELHEKHGQRPPLTF